MYNFRRFKGTIVNRERISLNEGSLEITSTVPLSVMFKGTVNVISSDPPFKDGNSHIITVPLKPLNPPPPPINFLQSRWILIYSEELFLGLSIDFLIDFFS